PRADLRGGRGGARGGARGSAGRRLAERTDRRPRGAAEAPALAASGGHGPRRRADPPHGAGGVNGPLSPTRRSADHGAAVLDSPHRTRPVRTLDTGGIR